MNNSLQAHQETASSYFNKGNLFKQSGKLEEAAAAYLRCTEINPDFSWYHHNLGEVLAKLGQWDAAEKSYRSACELNANSAWSWHNLGEVLEQQGNLDAAVTAYRKAVELYPDFYEFHNSLGKALCLQGQLDESISCLRHAIDLDSESALPYQNLWEALARQGRVNEGIECLQRAIELNPGEPELYLKLAEALQGKNELAEAAGYYRKAIQLQPDGHWAHYKLGTALSAQGKWEEAIASYSRAAELEPGSAIVHHYLGHTLSIVQRWDEAIESYRKALELVPNAAVVYQHLGDALTTLGRWEQAVEAYWKSVEFEPNSLEAQDHLGFALYQLGQYDEAVSAYRKALEISPGSDVVQCHLADALIQLGTQSDLDEAYNFYNKAIAVNPNNLDNYHKLLAIKPQSPGICLQLGKELLRRNNFDGALVFYQMALQIQPNNLQISRELDELLEKKLMFGKRNFSFNYSISEQIYADWLLNNSPTMADCMRMVNQIEQFNYKPLISIVMPVYNTPESFLREAIQSVIDQIYPYWELCIADDASTKHNVQQILEEYAAKDTRIKVILRQDNGHISACSNSALSLATGEFISLLDHDDTLTLDALYEVVQLLNRHREADMIYSDEDKLNEARQQVHPFFKPEWCPDTFLSTMYTCHLGTYRHSLVNEIGGFRLGYEGSQDYDFVLRFTEKTDKIFHIPKILYHWRIHPASVAGGGVEAKPYAYEACIRTLEDTLRRRCEPGRVITNNKLPGHFIIRYDILEHKMVSIIILTRNLGDILEKCIKSIFEKSTYPNYEVIVIDNGSDEPETTSLLAYWKSKKPEQFKYYELNIPFNYSRLNNYAVTKAQGDYLLFLNNDTEVITPDWIEGMVEQAQRQSIGAVGALLLYPDNSVQHAGMVLGVKGIVGHSHRYFSAQSPGYYACIATIDNYSAVTGACLMCRRDIFEKVRGFDEELSVAYNDVDLCLKILQQGYRNIYLPHVVLYHHELQSWNDQDNQQRFQQEVKIIKQRWGSLLDNDPCYSPYLSREREDYSIRRINDGLVKVLPVSLFNYPKSLLGFSIDLPKSGQDFHGDLILISGWVLGKNHVAVAVEVICQNEVIKEIPVNVYRPDVAKVFPVPEAVYSGFASPVEVIKMPHNAELIILAALEDGSRIPLGWLHLQRRDGSPGFVVETVV
jgi:tetratricopeptide (TPR) repeat protein/glycosyltransferase involved in cell wall biosynthesis